MAYNFSQNKRKSYDPGKSIVDMHGYMNQQRRIENMLREGTELRQFRTQMRKEEEDAVQRELNSDSPVPPVYQDKVEQEDTAMRIVDELNAKYQKKQKEALEARQAAHEAHLEDVRKKAIDDYKAIQAANLDGLPAS